MKIEAEIQNLKNILVNDEKFYQIPDFQRPYSWDKDNVSDLMDDLLTAHMESKGETYFCGSLVLVNNKEDDRFDIIDGQQRMTTFIIISCVLRDVYFDSLGERAKDFINHSIQDKFENNKRKLKFLTSEKYQVDFEQTVLAGISFVETKNIEREFHDNKYIQNAHYIRNFIEEKIPEKITNIDINEFAEWFFKNVVLTVITCPSQDNAIQIFNVLNDRGMPLSPIDILKSSLMQKIDGKEDRKAFKVTWEEINSHLKFAEFGLDEMLSSYLYYSIATNPKSRLDKELLNVFRKEKISPIKTIQKIKTFSKAFVRTLTEQDKNLYCLRYLKHEIYWRSILSTALYTNYQDINELKSLLVAYYYQNWIAGATVARIKQTSFNIIQLVKSGDTIGKIRKTMSENLKTYSTTKTFKEEIKGNWVYGRKWDRATLLLIEYFSSDNCNQNYISIGNKLHLEHVLPQDPTEEWEKIFTKEDIEKWTNSLANLTLLSMKKNIQAKNYSFEKKLEVYQNKNNVVSSYLITQDIIKCNKWDVSELEKRKDRLVKKVMEKLDLFE